MTENGRTHEPDFRELVVQLDGLIALYEERDRRYEDRFKAQEVAVAAALAAAEKLTAAAFAASKEAILKAEASQTGVNERSNEFRGQLADQAATLMPRRETETLVTSIRELIERQQKEIVGLRESRSGMVARDENIDRSRGYAHWVISAVISIFGILTSVAIVALSRH